MSTPGTLQHRQLALLLRVALKLDFRSRGLLPGRRSRRANAFVLTLAFYIFVGLAVGLGMSLLHMPVHLYATILYTVAAVFVLFNVLIEYQEILMAPADGDVLFWRPIPSRTLFLAKVIHVVLYSTTLAVAILVFPTFFVLQLRPQHAPLVVAAFGAGGLLNALAATGLAVLIYGLLLRYVSAERLQDVLAYVQLAFSMLIYLTYQTMGPMIRRFRLGENATVLSWFHLVPSAWFAALPAAADRGPDRSLVVLIVLGLASLALFAVYSLRRLAPRYEAAIAAVGASGGGCIAAPSRPRRLEALFGNLVARQPLRRAGYDFFLANLRGDRKVKVALLPIVGMPLAMLIWAFAVGRIVDPYEFARAESPASPAQQVESVPAPAGAARSAPPAGVDDVPDEEPGSHVSPVRFYIPAYMLALVALSISRIISASSSWRASWVFHGAPIRRFDRFYSGVLWGVVYGLILPAAGLMAVALLLAWRQPLHVAAHLALPCALALLAFPISIQIDPAPPFSREPQRSHRSKEAVISLAMTVPLVLMGAAHFALRRHPLGLLGISVLFGGLGLSLWPLANRRVRAAILAHPYDG